MSNIRQSTRPPRSGNNQNRAQDTPEVRMSKALSYILRHGAQKEGLAIRADGYIKVDDLFKRPKLRGLDFPTLEKLVKNNEKQRFQLLFESSATSSSAPATAALAPGVNTSGTWWIRANQGHTLKVEDLDLTEVLDASQLPVAVHGTTRQAWESISRQGLSKMARNHIHLATGRPGDPGVKSMRASSTVLIFIDVPKAVKDGFKFFISANGVVLTEGNKDGFIPPQYFKSVESRDGTAIV
ncbi:hypothetical protein BOTBODRAFT_102921 [Botryobasidium botryosum FD-172 SS1]|uniref:2'-phosphotransferase n=1 Tax=Botryobasidium botryosum (strain FD-172 SS1) TaxID=930990 RepID=A0A067MW90_BOTB1|nr:hypothetical protein BOTBODRAFT_102921 [Botryobasidium botryosum FD-172 SS1]